MTGLHQQPVQVRLRFIPFFSLRKNRIPSGARVDGWRTATPIVIVRRPLHRILWPKARLMHELLHIVTGHSNTPMHHPWWHFCVRSWAMPRLFRRKHCTSGDVDLGEALEDAATELLEKGEVYVIGMVTEDQATMHKKEA